MKRAYGIASEVGIPKMALPKLEPSQPMTTRCKPEAKSKTKTF